MRLVLAAALSACCAAPALAEAPLALNPADTNHDGVVSPQEAAAWLDRDRGVIVPVRLSAPARAAVAAEQRRIAFDQGGLLRPNDFRSPPPEQRPPEDLFYKDFKKIEK